MNTDLQPGRRLLRLSNAPYQQLILPKRQFNSKYLRCDTGPRFFVP